MSFQTYFDKADKENKELLAEFNKKSNDLPIEVEKLIATKPATKAEAPCTLSVNNGEERKSEG